MHTGGGGKITMPCHDILVETAIQTATMGQIQATEEMWGRMVDSLGLKLPAVFLVRPASDGSLVFERSYSSDPQVVSAVDARRRYEQTYVARQLRDALAEDGYEITDWIDPDHEGTWVIEARDITRNARIGVVVYHTLEFEIDFLDGSHDDSVWLAGGEFGRVLNRVRAIGLSAEVVRLDVNEEAKRQIQQSNGMLAL
jgi:hypothetical protein